VTGPKVARHLFIYWRIPQASLGAALQAVQEAQQRLKEFWPSLSARVYERCDPAHEATVMETYEAPEGIDLTGQARIEAELAQALAPLPAGQRHVEAFQQR